MSSDGFVGILFSTKKNLICHILLIEITCEAFTNIDDKHRILFAKETFQDGRQNDNSCLVSKTQRDLLFFKIYLLTLFYSVYK